MTVGLVARPHGVRGELKVEVTSDVPDRFAAGSELLLRRRGGEVETVHVVTARPLVGALLVRLAEVADRDAAEALRGASLEIARADVPPAPEGIWYHFELVGCRCIDRREGDLGTVVDLLDDGGGLLLVVADGEREILVPFVHAMVREVVARDVDPADRRIELDLPPGLLETCAVTSAADSAPRPDRPPAS